HRRAARDCRRCAGCECARRYRCPPARLPCGNHRLRPPSHNWHNRGAGSCDSGTCRECKAKPTIELTVRILEFHIVRKYQFRSRLWNHSGLVQADAISRILKRKPKEFGEERMAEQNKKKPNPIDAHVGGRIRMRRNMLGMSQEKLGESLGIT